MGGKHTVVELGSKKHTWESLEIPQNIKSTLYEMGFKKPSII